MDRLTRYVLHQSLMVALAIGVVFSAAVWLLESLRLIDLIVNRGLSIGLFLYLAVLILPRFIDVVLPIAVFTAVLFVYYKLIAESEMVAMRASGMSQWALAKPALMVGLAGTLVLYSLSLYLLPTANRAFKDLQFEIRNKFASVLIQEGVFNTISDNLMIYVKGHDSNGDLTGLLIQDSNDRQKPVTIFAERGAVVDTADGPRIVLDNGTRQQYDGATGRMSTLTFGNYTLDLAGAKDDIGMRDRAPDELYINELLRHKNGARDPARTVELNIRLVDPLAALAMAALPMLCLLPGEFNRRGQARRILLAVILALGFEIVDVGFKNLAARSELLVLLRYANVLVPLAALWWLLWRGGDWGRGAAAKPEAPAA
jgi:lipopolysaccharide export system permease protein